MTRSDVMASSRPGTAAKTGRKVTAARVRRGLLLVPVLLALALVAPGVAAAAGESTSGYGQKPEEPKTTTTSPSEPKTGTSPSKEEEKASSPESGTEPSKSTSPTSSTGTSPAKASSLPFTGLDLRWTVAIGLLLVAGGFAIVLAQRRARSGS